MHPYSQHTENGLKMVVAICELQAIEQKFSVFLLFKRKHAKSLRAQIYFPKKLNKFTNRTKMYLCKNVPSVQNYYL